MSRYYVNKKAQANGDHEVHVSTCSFLPEAEHRQYLGEFSNCHSAVAEANGLVIARSVIGHIR